MPSNDSKRNLMEKYLRKLKKNWCSNFVNLWTQREVAHGKKTHDNN